MKLSDLMQSQVASVKDSDELSLALQMMLWRGIHHLPVTDGGRIVGILTERDVLARAIHHDGGGYTVIGLVRDAMQTNVHTMSPETNLADAAGTLVTTGATCLPVVESGKLVGIVTITDLLSHMAQVPVPKPSRVGLDASQVMTAKVTATRPGDRLLDAAATMVNEGTRHLPVLDGIDRVVGILSDRDVRSSIGNPIDALEDRARTDRIRHLRVSDAMTENPRTVRPEASIEELVHIFARERFGAVLVVDDDDKLLGIVSYVDVLASFDEQS